jgi:Fic family protein
MEQQIYNFSLNLDWKLVNLISQIDRFDANWTAIERKEGQTLKQLKSIATVRSVGASTRIEGSKMSDEEVDILLKAIDISKLEDRDSQEVAGYYEALDTISESFPQIDIKENSIKNLHNILMRYSKKDEWHKGNYKTQSNAVEATFPDGTKQIVFQTTPPGYATEDAMLQICDWYSPEKETHNLVKTAAFVYEFLSIHPFQDGNGRLSRLISTLLLLKTGYKWIEYVSFEHEIENRKSEYYRVLRSCQAQRPSENITDWIMFFFDALRNIQEQLLNKLHESGSETQLSSRDKSIVALIANNSGIKSGEIAERLSIPSPTVKRILSDLNEKGFIEKYGTGRGTNYAIK